MGRVRAIFGKIRQFWASNRRIGRQDSWQQCSFWTSWDLNSQLLEPKSVIYCSELIGKCHLNRGFTNWVSHSLLCRQIWDLFWGVIVHMNVPHCVGLVTCDCVFVIGKRSIVLWNTQKRLLWTTEAAVSKHNMKFTVQLKTRDMSEHTNHHQAASLRADREQTHVNTLDCPLQAETGTTEAVRFSTDKISLCSAF